MRALRRVAVSLAVVGALVAALSCTPLVQGAPRRAGPEGGMTLVLLNNSWVDYKIYGRTTGGWMYLCTSESFRRTDCPLPTAVVDNGASRLTIKAESRLWRAVKVFDSIALPKDAVAIVVQIQNHLSTSYIAEAVL